jgi:hypothetical protein
MATNKGVSLPDEQEQQSAKQSAQSVKPDDAKLRELSEQQLKSAIIAVWKKHEELAKQDLAPRLYWLRDKLRAQGARNDVVHDKDRGFGAWVEEHLDISRRTAGTRGFSGYEESGLPSHLARLETHIPYGRCCFDIF